MTEFFTADLHFRHKGILGTAPGRGFATTEAMDAHLIQRWQDTVGPRDTVWVLGDFILGQPDAEEIDALITLHLPGRINLVPGNHDTPAKLDIYRKYLDGKVRVLNRLHTHKIGTTYLELCHFPLAFWERQNSGAGHLHGHTHGYPTGVQGRAMDVGIDTHPEFRPYTASEVIEQLSKHSARGHHFT